MQDFFMFYAPFLVVFAGIALSFVVVLNDDAVTGEKRKK